MLVAQSMVASRYTHFKKESLEWQRSLSFVSDVMTMLNGIQVTISRMDSRAMMWLWYNERLAAAGRFSWPPLVLKMCIVASVAISAV